MKHSVKIAAVTAASLLILCSCGKEPSDTSSKEYDSTFAEEFEFVNYSFDYNGDVWEKDRNDGTFTLKVKKTKENPNDNSSISCICFDAGSPGLTAQAYWLGSENIEKDIDAENEVPVSPEDEVVGYFEKICDTFKSVSVEKGYPKNFKMCDTDAIKSVYIVDTPDGKYKFGQAVMVKDGIVYTITLTSRPETFQNHLDDFEHACSSFKID